MVEHALFYSHVRVGIEFNYNNYPPPDQWLRPILLNQTLVAVSELF